LLVFHRYKQQRFQIVAFFPPAITFLADSAVFPRDDVRPPEQTARIGFTGLSVRAETLGFGMLRIAME
jgi:hypothetical protein